MLNIQFFTIGSEIAFSSAALVHKKVQMLKINRAANGVVVFTVSGQMDANNVTELRALFASEGKGRRIVLDLKDLTLVVQDWSRLSNSGCCDSSLV